MKNSMKKLSFLLFALVLVLAACGSGGSNSSDSKGNETNKKNESSSKSEKTYKIGISQYVEHPSLNAATEGFKKAIEDAGLQVEYNTQVAQGDNSLNTTIANNLVSANVDLIFANSTPSAQSAATATSDIPIIFTSVTDAVGAQLINSMEEPGKNVTGTVDLHPDTITKTVAFLKELGIKKVGMVYSTGEQNSVAQVKEVKKIAAEHDLAIVEANASTSAEVKQATESLVGKKVEAFYIITDNIVVNALESVIDVANTNKLPLIVGELDSVERGGLAAYGFEYYDIGYEAGQMAVKILKGEATPADTPAQYPQNLKLLVNKKVADSLGIDIKDSWGAELFE